MNKPIIFRFSGQDFQYNYMGNELFLQHPTFKKWMQYLNEIAYDSIGEFLLEKLYSKQKSINSLFNKTLYSHPTIFMIEYALAQV